MAGEIVGHAEATGGEEREDEILLACTSGRERMSDTASGKVRFRDQFKAAPMILRIYFVFAAIAGAMGLSLFYARPLYEKLLPYTGWMGLYFYVMTLTAASTAIKEPQRKPLLHLTYLLGIMTFFGWFDYYVSTHGLHLGGPDDPNPYLAYHPYRPLVTVLVPGVWLLLILSLLPKRWTKGA
jgi:hypothetical protein